MQRTVEDNRDPRNVFTQLETVTLGTAVEMYALEEGQLSH